ncbi:MAG TPA: hypothetical protein VH559_10330 [Gemmatimonadaceae bacterium]|jgi:hypothetical protein
MQQHWGMWSDVALVIFSSSSLVLAVGSVWLRVIRVSREQRAEDERKLVGRLEHIEQIVAATAIEVERVAEAQRFVAKHLALKDGPVVLMPERVITPH